MHSLRGVLASPCRAGLVDYSVSIARRSRPVSLVLLIVSIAAVMRFWKAGVSIPPAQRQGVGQQRHGGYSSLRGGHRIWDRGTLRRPQQMVRGHPN